MVYTETGTRIGPPVHPDPQQIRALVGRLFCAQVGVDVLSSRTLLHGRAREVDREVMELKALFSRWPSCLAASSLWSTAP